MLLIDLNAAHTTLIISPRVRTALCACSYTPPDYAKPWQSRSQHCSISSGFAVALGYSGTASDAALPLGASPKAEAAATAATEVEAATAADSDYCTCDADPQQQCACGTTATAEGCTDSGLQGPNWRDQCRHHPRWIVTNAHSVGHHSHVRPGLHSAHACFVLCVLGAVHAWLCSPGFRRGPRFEGIVVPDITCTYVKDMRAYMQVQVQKRGNAKKFRAEVLAIGTECDIALLTVHDEAFWKSLEPAKLGSLPRLQDDVTVLGYPCGGGGLSITAGVVSRIEVRISILPLFYAYFLSV